ncbi:ABC transporter permease [Frigoribacterium sp. R86507]|uniref:ABC transporter permease n=1 Tax=Frigoribacterium sp. R86507 TaxID=3093850 RepID=UPI0037CB6874
MTADGLAGTARTARTPRAPKQPKAEKPGRTGHLSPGDLLRLGVFGLRTRPTRVVLSALGIAIGIAAMIAVVGISSSSQAALDRVLDGLGTNLLQAAPGKSFSGDPVPLPEDSVSMLDRRDDVESAAGVGRVTDQRVYRTDRVPTAASGGITLDVVMGDLQTVLRGELASGSWFGPTSDQLPQVVLGATAAATLGIDHVEPDTRIWIGGRWVAVMGILEPLALAPDLDTSAFVPAAGAEQQFGFDGHPTQLFARAAPESVAAVRDLIAPTVNPADPSGVSVSRPSDALAAQQATEESFTGLLLGIGGVALLVGGIGVANTMVITVLERRAEVGVRRALGARRRHVRDQFLVESLLLSLLGGAVGVALGAGVTTVFAVSQGWPVTIPLWAVVGGLGATVLIGGVSGLYPASRAARIPPTSALAAT